MTAITRADLVSDDTGALTVRWVRDHVGWYRLLRVNATSVAVALPTGNGAIRIPINRIREVQA